MELILASKSPRRQELLRGMGLEFTILQQEADESYPPGLLPREVAEHIAANKAGAFDTEAINDNLLLAADTIVVLEDELFGKPAGREAAIRMLEKLSGRQHEVITGVALRSREWLTTFADVTTVCFAPMSGQEISFYVDNYRPFDKAGAYGIQEWIGYNKIIRIEGSYTNVVGLPTEKLYTFLSRRFPQVLSSSGRI